MPPPGLGKGRSGRRSWAGTQGAPRGRAGPKRKFTAAEKAGILADLKKSGESVPVFAGKRGLSGPTLYSWSYEDRGKAKGAHRARRPAVKGQADVAARPTYNGDQRRQAVEELCAPRNTE